MSCRTATVVAGSFVTMGNGLFSGIARFAPFWMVLVSFSFYFGIQVGNRQDRGQNFFDRRCSLIPVRKTGYDRNSLSSIVTGRPSSPRSSDRGLGPR